MVSKKIYFITILFSYVDKLVAFAFPLFLLHNSRDQNIYIYVEYVLTLSILIASFSDCGIRSYILYHSRTAESPSSTTEKTISAAGVMITLHIILITVIGFILYFIDSSSNHNNYLIITGMVRASALSIIGLYSQLMILDARPQLAPLFSMLLWMTSSIAYFYSLNKNTEFVVMIVFLPCWIIVLGGIIYLIYAGKFFISREGISYFISAVLWSWPILTACALTMFVANFSKLYVFNIFSQTDIVNFSFWMRVFSIVQISHVAISNIISLDIYRSSIRGVLPKETYRYLIYIVVPTVLSFILCIISPNIFLQLPKFNLFVVLFIGLYTVLWCLGSYLEIYLSRSGRNFDILKASFLSAVMYCIILYLFPPKNIITLGSIMCLSSGFYLFLIIKYIRRIQNET